MDGLQDEAQQVDEGAAQQAQDVSAQASSGEGAVAGGVGGADGSTQLSRWRKIAGLPESEE